MAMLASRNMITILAGITGVIHLVLGITQSNPLFLANGVGYLVLLYLTFWTPAALKGQKSLIRWVFIGYTALTIIMFFVRWGADGLTDVMGMFTKVVELLLLIGLWQSKDK